MADDDQKTEDKAKGPEPVEAVEEAADKAEESADVAQDAAKEAEKSEEAAEKAEEKAQAAEEKAADAAAEAKEAVAEVKEEAKEKPKPQVNVSKKLEGIIKDIEELSVLELSELVKALETRFGVTAAAPMAVAAGGAAPAGGDEGVSEQTTFNVILADGGANKISVIKAVREIVPTLGLKEAKDLVDAAPKPVVEGVNKETANEAKTKLEAAGAKVELK